MRILERYLGLTILQYTLIAMLVLLGLFTFVNFLDQLSSIGKGNYNLSDAIIYIILVMPRIIYDLFPMAALLGSIIGLSVLANDSELIIMRASGVSMLQITLATLKMGGLFVLAAMLIGELVSPYTETYAAHGRAVALQEDVKQHTNFGLWLRQSRVTPINCVSILDSLKTVKKGEGNPAKIPDAAANTNNTESQVDMKSKRHACDEVNSYVNIGEISPDLRLLDIQLFEFDEKKILRSTTTAKSASWEDDYWLMKQVRQTLMDAHGNAEIVAVKTIKWAGVSPEILSAHLGSTGQLSIFQLSRYLNHLNQNQQNTDPYELTFWNKIMLPFSTAVMVVLAIPFVFTNIRSGTIGRNLFIGIMLGIGFYVIHKGLGYVVLANGIPPVWGATLPVIVFAGAALVMIRRIE